MVTRIQRISSGDIITSDVVSQGVLIPYGNLLLWSDAELAAFGFARTTSTPVDVFIPTISDRQFFQQLALDGVITEQEALDAIGPGIIPAVLLAFIDVLPEPEKFAARCVLTGATTFERNHPLTEMVRIARNMTPAETDLFFTRASLL